jgi:hypothetical protein
MPAGNLDVEGCTINGLGSSSTAAMGCIPTGTCIMLNNTITNSGMVDFMRSTTASGSAVVRFEGNVFSGSLGANSFQAWAYYGSPKTTGTRTIQWNVFDHGNGSSSLQDFTLEDNYFGRGWGVFGYPDTGTTFSRNFVHLETIGLNSSRNTEASGTFRDIYFDSDFHVTSAATSGGGGHTFAARGAANDIQRIILETSDRQDTDSTDSMFGDYTSGTLAWSYILELPDATGQSAGQMTSKAGQAGQVYSLQHATWWAGSAGKTLARWGETAADVANAEEVRSSIAFAPGGGIGTWYIGKDINATLNTDVCPPAMCDYNAALGYTATDSSCSGCTNQGNGYRGKFSSTPGAHDLHLDPRWADYQRNVALFDSRYLGNTAPAWTSGTTYNAGDIVSSAVPGTWWGLAVNYRQVVGSGCTSKTVQPGTMTSDQNPSPWRASDGGTGCWELASLYRLRQATGAQTRIYDGAIQCGYGCTYIEALLHWVWRGFTPQEPRLRKGGHDGKDIGAVAMDPIHVIVPAVF